MNTHTEPVWLTILNRRGTMLFNNFVIVGQSADYFQKMLGFNFAIRNFKYVDGEISIDLEEVGQLGAIVGKRLEESSEFLREFIESCKQQCKTLLEISQQISKIKNPSLLSNDELKEWFSKYIDEVLKMMPFLNIFSILERMFQERISEGVGEKLTEKDKSDLLDIYIKDLIFPKDDNYVVKEIDNLVKIAVMIQKRLDLIEFFQGSIEDVKDELPSMDDALFGRLQEHIGQFGFLNMYTYEGNPLTIGDVILMLKGLLKRDNEKRLRIITEEKEQTKKRYNEIIRELQINGNLLQFIEYAQEYLYLRLYRLDVLFIAGRYVRSFLEEIGNRMGISYNDILNFRHEEIMLYMDHKGKVDKAEMKRRKEGYATILIDGELEVISGREELKKIIKKMPKDDVQKYQSLQELEGTVASVGKHIGAAKLVESKGDNEKVKEGDILVSTMTNPYFVPAMIRAGAIITDEGGILCHAAIVSRELGVPCIIGTNVATKVLSDNDLVEVDATGKKGAVKIISRA